MSKESLNDINLFGNVLTILKESESTYSDETTNRLINYYESFMNQYTNRTNDETEYLSDLDGYHKFRDNFLVAYKHYINMPNAKFAIPLFIYLYDSNPIGFSMEVFDSFVSVAENISFNDLLGIYDVYTPGMNLENTVKQARA